METVTSPTGSVRRAGRNISHPIVRRSTKGPLDSSEDPLANASTPVGEDDALTQDVAVTSASAERHGSPQSPQAREPTHTRATSIDLRFLQDPRAYHRELPEDEVIPAFLQSDHKPAPNTPLPELLRKGHFRIAADHALRAILRLDTGQPEHLFRLIHCRLACLVLVGRPELAADEAVVLLDFLSSNTVQSRTILPIVPWELRVLIVRLQSIAAQDGGRRAIMATYALASESRTHLKNVKLAGDGEEIKTWTERLHDLGLRIADTLVEIGELETADRHLDTLTADDPDEVLVRKAVLQLRGGHIARARQSIPQIKNDQKRSLLEDLLDSLVPDSAGNHDNVWSGTVSRHSSELAANNHAIFMLYVGRISEAKAILEKTVDSSPVFATLLFNLSTIYELCGETATSNKLALIDKIAAQEPEATCGGWEHPAVDFKL